MRKFLSLALALVMVFSVAVIATSAAGTAADTAKVTVYDTFGNVADTAEYNVGDTFTCTVYLDTSAISPISSIKGTQTYTSSILTLADELQATGYGVKDADTVYPVTKKTTVDNAKNDGQIIYNASTPYMGEDGYRFDLPDAVLICTQYTVAAAGEAEIHNNLQTLAQSDYHVTRIINKGIIVNNNFTMPCDLSESTAASGVTVSGQITSFLDDSDVTVKLEGVDNNFTTEVTGKTEYSITGVAAGTYTLTVSKKNHVTRTYDVTVADAAVTQAVKIHPIGDINGDGKITTLDAGRANAHARGNATLTGYEFDCANVVPDVTEAKITTMDAGRINAHARGISFLWTV